MFKQNSIPPSIRKKCKLYGVPDYLAPVCQQLTQKGIKALGKAYKAYQSRTVAGKVIPQSELSAIIGDILFNHRKS